MKTNLNSIKWLSSVKFQLASKSKNSLVSLGIKVTGVYQKAAD
jgi:hypothetical protein